MIKDIVANLSLRDSPDGAMEFAVSVAAAFNAHLAGIAFVYEPLAPVMIDMYGMPAEVIESQRVENEKAAKVAVGRLDEAARSAGAFGRSAYARCAGRDGSRHFRESLPAGSTCRSSVSRSRSSLRLIG